MILLNLIFPTKPAAAPPPPLRKGVVVQQTLAVPAEPLQYLWCSSAARYFPASVRNNGDSPSRRLHQGLKIQAGCRPCRHTLPDPNNVDGLWSKNSTAVSAPNISAPRADGWDALR